MSGTIRSRAYPFDHDVEAATTRLSCWASLLIHFPAALGGSAVVFGFWEFGRRPVLMVVKRSGAA